MALNPRQYLVLVKGKDRTDDILCIEPDSGLTSVTFENGAIYRYGRKNIEWLANPVAIPVENRRIFMGEDMLSGVVEVLRFGKWVKVFHKSGGSRCCPLQSLSIRQAEISNGRNKDVLAYFRELSEGSSLRTDTGDSILARKYRVLDLVSHRSILSGFLRTELPGSDQALSEMTSRLIFPFGCNMSQKSAVLKALQNRVSVVQGPPGTGKTQTILNLIANLMLQNKRVAVVSSNNAATANVLEKLRKYDLDFLTAFLGSSENKKAFIQNQQIETVRLPTLREGAEAHVDKEIFRLSRALDEAFLTQNELAAVIQQLDGFRLELSHFEKFRRETGDPGLQVEKPEFPPEVPARKLLEFWWACDPDTGTRPNTGSPIDRLIMFLSKAAKALDSKGSIREFFRYLEKIRLLLRFGLKGRAFFNMGIEEIIPILQKAFYLRKIGELEETRKRLESSLAGFRFEQSLEQLTALSMKLLKHRLAKRYNCKSRKRFSLEDLSAKPEEFLEEYPIVLSTTFSVVTALKSGFLFDCIIVDEASQVDMLSGTLAMACAKNLVIVGDPMQLPNVLTEQDKARAIGVARKYQVPEHARFEKQNLLTAVRAAFPGIPETLLREHYRCHPKIIGFCNRKFYGGELLIMTRDQGEVDVLKAYVTVAGRHARGTFNQRQIDEVVENVLPGLDSYPASDIGIVSPFRMQADMTHACIDSQGIEIDTVHKYQGREKRAMILMTVADVANGFVDNANMLNVAISRAQEKIRIVVSKEMAEGNGNIADFVRHIRYLNCEVIPGKVRSIFDLLYGEYSGLRSEKLKKRKRISTYDSENLAHAEIEEVLRERNYQGYGVVFQFPLAMLVKDLGFLTGEERSYATHPWTKADFLIYRKIDKSPVLAIEVDGYAFHREGSRQAERDRMKDSVLRKCGLPILRLSTVGSDERNRIRKNLGEIAGG